MYEYFPKDQKIGLLSRNKTVELSVEIPWENPQNQNRGISTKSSTETSVEISVEFPQKQNRGTSRGISTENFTVLSF